MISTKRKNFVPQRKIDRIRELVMVANQNHLSFRRKIKDAALNGKPIPMPENSRFSQLYAMMPESARNRIDILMRDDEAMDDCDFCPQACETAINPQLAMFALLIASHSHEGWDYWTKIRNSLPKKWKDTTECHATTT